MKIGIFGGTFDPIHVGHLILADSVRQTAKLDKILFIPTGDPPHKIKNNVTSAMFRYTMVELAVEGNPFFDISAVERDRNGYTYTIDTLKKLKETYPLDEMYFIIGADVLGELFTWKDYREVFSMCTFLAVQRPGFSKEQFDSFMKSVQDEGAKITIISAPLIDISSTKIREIVSEGGSIKYMVPKKVDKFIRKNALYLPVWTLEGMMEDLKTKLSARRFEHSISVMNECIRLAKIYKADVGKCALAGLLHDMAKEMDKEEQRKLFDLEHEKHDGYTKKVLHGYVGSILAKRTYHITDEEVLEAIRYHIMGHPGMSLTASIVFISDYTEPLRKGVFFDEVRKALETGLNDAIIKACDNVIRNIIDRQEQLCVMIIRTRNYFMEQKRGE